MTDRWWDRFRVARRTAIGLAILGFLAVVCVFGAAWRASWIVKLLRDWAARTIAQQSGGVYQLDLGRVRFDWALRRVAVEAIRLTTRRAISERRPQSLPRVRLALYHCTISGVHFVTLVRRGGLIAGSFGCRSGSLVVEVPRRVPTGGPGEPSPAPAGRTFGERQAFLVFQQGVRLPSYAHRVRIARVVFQRLALEVRLPRTAGGATRLELERLQWSMADLVIDPADTTAAARPARPVPCPYPVTPTLEAWALQRAERALKKADAANRISFDSARATLRELADTYLALAAKAQGRAA